MGDTPTKALQAKRVRLLFGGGFGEGSYVTLLQLLSLPLLYLRPPASQYGSQPVLFTLFHSFIPETTLSSPGTERPEHHAAKRTSASATSLTKA